MGAAYRQYNENLKPYTNGTTTGVSVTVRKGSNMSEVASLLQNKGLIRSKWAVMLYARLNGLDSRLKAGDFMLQPSWTAPEILNKITEGAVEYVSFTIPEGYNTKQIADTLAKKGLINRQVFMEQVANGDFNYDFLAGLPHDERRMEGFLFPDTYKITHKTTEKQIIEMMLARCAKELTPEFRQKAQAQGLTLNQAVTLASIIEREAKVDAERPKVASVFLNRIKKGMRLESCATVQYALGENKTRLLNKDLQINSPYNTYRHKGLPPGPIASPGQPSLLAAVNPAPGNYLFFVVFQNGEHVFSKTLAEHNRAKAKYVQNTFGK